MKVGIYNLGCKVNLYESEYIISLFKERGYEIVPFEEECDIYVINTCTVTNNADLKSRKVINHIRNNYPNACLVVCGCFIESATDFNLTGINIVIGNYNKSKIVDLVEEHLKNKIHINEKYNMQRVPFEDMEIKHFEDRTRAFVKIQDGCENYCAYCIIPYVRGKCRSKEQKKVINEITNLVNNNYKEIVLTGIHTGNYGKDLNTSFSALLEDILKIKNLQRLRISSIEITELDDKFLELLKNNILCNHLHIPLQSGSDKILKLMNRKYNKEQFINIINKIRKVRSDISITTDVIVGFPNETEEDFQESMEFIKKINFSKIHVFPYSKRNGTVAANMKNQIDGNIKKDRVKRLINLSEELEKKYKDSFIGKEVNVLIEKNEDNYSYGHTGNYLYLKLNDNINVNSICKVIVKKEML